MTFVNQVAEVLHGVVSAYNGAPAKNNSDMFLAVWTIDESRMHGEGDACISKLSDMAILAWVLILGGINRSATLAIYRTHPGIQMRLGRKSRVSMTFGMHYGWAIEGALGSEYKIDPTYISPNVSICENVQNAAEVYGTHIIVTEAFHERLSMDMASKCRCIDRVKVRGQSAPMDIYSVDMYCLALSVQEKTDSVRWTSRQRFRARQFLEGEKLYKCGESYVPTLEFESHPDIVAMHAPYTIAFHEIFGMGYQNYVLGEWKTAGCLLSRTCTQLGFQDGPSAALLRFMQKPHGFKAPPKWAGVHALEDMPARRMMSFRP
jgi:class 3 adenylate cyclase